MLVYHRGRADAADQGEGAGFGRVESSSTIVGGILQQGMMVVYESTVYPGVTEEVCLPILEKESGLKLGEFALGYSPEGGFTNRLDIYSCDSSNYNGFGSWKLADVGYSTMGTNQLRWLDLGRLGRGSPFNSGIRLYTAGKGADVDSDNDGYSDAYEQLVLNSDPNDGDTDNDGISKDKDIAYILILLSEGTPMVPISDYLYGANVNIDTNSSGWSTNNLKAEIDSFIDIRRTYAGGTTSYLSTQNTNDLFIMKRNGNATKPGCILVINDNDTTPLYDTGVNTGWASNNLVDVLQTNHFVSTDASGVVESPGLSAPPRGYRVYIQQGDLQ